MMLTDPCNEDCENYRMCYERCAKYIVFHKLYIDFNGFKLWFSDLSVAESKGDYGQCDFDTNLITINVTHLRGIEETLSHEIEHALFYDLLRKLGLTHEQANFGSILIFKPSYGDKMLMYRKLASTCCCCGENLTPIDVEPFWSPDEEHFLCRKCEEEFLSYLPSEANAKAMKKIFKHWLSEEKGLLWLKNG